MDLPSESGSIGSVKLPHNLLAISSRITSHPLALVPLEKLVDIWHSVEAPGENSMLLCNYTYHLVLGILHLGVTTNLPLLLDAPPIRLSIYRIWLVILRDVNLIRVRCLIRRHFMCS
ncbi:hypothetical protein H5410_001596 [Solanum commersonii]|uniref:Uncharacterized protein n=1 Tax=Solanum commersonii TaxID=4109 RepID=A0A9J6B0J4_SOLCO|nr:hypothetical protein H5410_001596 [Solanum commersonii]